VKNHRGSTDIPNARRSAASIALPHDKSDGDRAAELEKLLARVATGATPAGRRQALKNFPADGTPKLELVGDPLPPPGPSTHAANTAFVARTFELASGTTGTVDYIAIAKTEFDKGQIDQPLWARAFVEAGGDESSAMPHYLRARATVLRLKDRVRKAEGAGSYARASPATAKTAVSSSRHAGTREKSREDAGRDARIKAFLRSPITILATLIIVVTAVTLGIALRPERATVEPIVAARPDGAAQRGSAVSGKLASTNNEAAGADAKSGFMKAIKEAKGAGHWNDVVLQATAWTEKEPENAAAWNELSIGYANTQRPDEAHAAARRAVQLAPNNALWWKNLGQLSLDRDAPVEALLAFEEATRWNAKDGESFVQIGILNARLDHLSDAKLAFDNALALNPGDVSARCGASFVVQRQARADAANGSAKAPKAANAACRDLIDQASRSVDVSGPAASSNAPSQGR